ncbi:MAG: cell envelope biogenesis protein OmpA, partial [Cyanobacteria bacterium J06554_1]
MTYYKSIRTLVVSLLLATAATSPSLAQTVETSGPTHFPKVQIKVNSPQDGPIMRDNQLTLREAIAITNGTLTTAELSNAEQQQVAPGSTNSVIAFDLPADDTTIELQSLLPALAQPGLVIDGTTQAGYDATKSATAEISVA